MKTLIWVLFVMFSLGNASPCDISGEAAVVRCAADLVLHQFGAIREDAKYADQPFVAVPLRQLSQMCSKYDAFLQCTNFVDDECRTSMLTNLMSLWNFVCATEFTKTVTENLQCFETAENDINIQRCLIDAMEDFDTEVGNSTVVSIAQRREHRCILAKKQLNCFTEFQFLKKCQPAVELQHKLLSFIVNNVSDLSSSCEIPTFSAIVDKFKVVERELSRGGCNANGECSCVPGFKFDNATRKCIDLNECEDGTALCSQKCENTEGSYSCKCDERYYKIGADNSTCERIDNTPVWLYFAHGQSIWNLSETGRDFQLARMGLQKTAMIDVDVKEQKLYYADIGTNVIERKSIDGAFPQPLQTYEVDGVEGIAVDWIGRNLYTARKHNIFVQTLEGKYRKTLYKDKLTMPRALVVNPIEGMMYGTDWSSNAFIFKAAMDGTSFEKIVTENIVWPNTLVIDQYANRIYWADAFLDKIESCDLDGKNRRTIISDPDAVPHVFGMTIADNYLYWTDWTFRGILRANKLTGKNITVLAQTALLPYGIKAYHQTIQPESESPCSSMACSQLCLLTKDKKVGECKCSDGFELESDGKTCKSNCSSNQIFCGGADPKCISKKYLCDGIAQCSDQADERNCPPRICLPGQFQCHDNKKCLEPAKICNNLNECEDNSDEIFCERNSLFQI